MMKITRENYEEFVLDYLEGKLNSGMAENFRLFLEVNPEIEEEIESFETFELSPSGLEFTGKDSIKKNEIDLLDAIPPVDRACIAALEQDLDESSLEKFHHELLQHPEKGIIFQNFSKTILKPEPVTFESKNTLKKPIPIVRKNRLLVWYAAASVILLLLLIRPFMSYNPVQKGIVQTRSEPSSTDLEVPATGDNITIKKDGIQKKALVKVLAFPEKPTENHKKTLFVYSASVKKMLTPGPEDGVINPLSGKNGILPQENFNTLTLHAPIIYIPVYLDTKDLKALENLNLDDFRVKIIQEPVEQKETSVLFALLRKGIKKLNKETEPVADPGSKVNEKGKLTAFAFSAPNFKFRTKGKNKTPKISPNP